jgi:hypothetical protein
MRTKMRSTPPEVALNRVLAGLAQDLAEATDEEVVQAGEDLRMNVKMKGSAAFIGVLYTLPKRFEEIFDVAELRRNYEEFLRKQRSSLPPGRKDRSDDDDGET